MMNDQTNNPIKISNNIDDNLTEIYNNIYECPDIITREILQNDKVKGFFLYVDKLINIDGALRYFINPIIETDLNKSNFTERIPKLPLGNLHYNHTIKEILEDVLSGHIVFLCNDMDFALASNFSKSEHRAIAEPVVEKNIKGSHEGFIESIDVNISILRKKINNTNLKFKLLKLGASTNQTVAISYIQGIANEELVSQVYKKISALNLDGFNGIGYIEQLIQDHPNSLFPQFHTTERPDKVAPALLEGRIVVMLDGTPVMMILPVTFYAFFQTPDDFTHNWIVGSLFSMLRIFGMLLALFLPGIYIAILTFHYYMIPLNLIIAVAESRIKVPFPPIIEALIMEFIIEMLREAAIRLPTYVGSSIGVVGGLVLGQAAVEAGIVSNLMVIIVAVTAIASFVIPSENMSYAVRITRFVIMIMSATFGMIGVTISLVLILAHLLTLESLGQPYLQPFIPLKISSFKEAGIRLPIQFLKKRPNDAKPKDKMRGK
jgi:spore germination protein